MLHNLSDLKLSEDKQRRERGEKKAPSYTLSALILMLF
jgi:hypothetical protein